eukprot:gene9306-biopygen6195
MLAGVKTIMATGEGSQRFILAWLALIGNSGCRGLLCAPARGAAPVSALEERRNVGFRMGRGTKRRAGSELDLQGGTGTVDMIPKFRTINCGLVRRTECRTTQRPLAWEHTRVGTTPHPMQLRSRGCGVRGRGGT